MIEIIKGLIENRTLKIKFFIYSEQFWILGDEQSKNHHTF